MIDNTKKNLIIEKLNKISEKIKTDKESNQVSYQNVKEEYNNKADKYRRLKNGIISSSIKNLNKTIDINSREIEKSKKQLKDIQKRKNDLLDEMTNSVEMDLWSDNDQLAKTIDIDTSKYDSEILKINEELNKLYLKNKNYWKEHDGYETDINEIKKYHNEDEYCSKEKLKLDQIDKQNKLFDDKIEECQRILREIDNYEKYIKYANDHQLNDLTNESNSLRNLIKKCNKHHQEYLLTKSNNGEGWFSNEVSVHCLNNYSNDSDDDDTKVCNGWYYNSRRCTCGNYKGWCWESDKKSIKNILIFSIDDDEPQGHAHPEW
ncbi:MAG: hypothetical protein O7C59_11780 [Rickettsia endosymbiont of Ixodes persulcatus]|nr:hypothetical protein [Rickettsia endosymbiont of Ixodes persulcatus]